MQLSNSDIYAERNIFALIAELETQFWAMDPQTLQAFFSQLTKQQSYLPEDIVIEGQSRNKTFRIKNATAVIEIKGVLLREVPRAFDFWGIEATSYNDIARQVTEALASDNVNDILLKVNSPGGAVAGLMETADLIRAAREKKPINAVVEEIGTSAAYWLSSQTDHIEAEANSKIGSIGVLTVYVDSSKRAEDMGFKVHLIKSGPYKGMGIPGVKITDIQISAIQDIVDGIADNFVAGVAAGRKREKKEVRGWANGQSWIAEKAVKMGLIDKISANESVQTINAIKEKSMDSKTEQINAQAEIKTAVQQATTDGQKRMAELQEAFADDLDFAVQAFGKGLTVEQAKAEYCDILQQRIKETAEKMVKVEVKNQVEKVAGAKAIATDGSDNETTGDFMLEVRRMVDEGKAKSLTEAMRKVQRQNPELHEAFKARCRAEGPEVFNNV